MNLQRMSWKTGLQLIKQTFEWIQMLKERKGKGFVLESIVLGKIRGGLFLYIVLNFSYKFDYRMFQCFFPPHLFLLPPFPFYIIPSSRSHFTRVYQRVGVDICPICTFHQSPCSSYKAETHCSGITSTLMRPESQLQCI